MSLFSKFARVSLIASLLVIGTAAIVPQSKADAAPKCLVKKSNITIQPGKWSPSIEFTTKEKFVPKLDITFYGNKKGKFTANIMYSEGRYSTSTPATPFTTKKQTKKSMGFINGSNDRNIPAGKKWIYFKNLYPENGTLYISSFCLHK